jgi:hypothetical protein
MKPKLLLRVAAVIIFLHAAAHLMGHLHWKETTDPEKQVVISKMTDHFFPFMGMSRSMADYFEGFSNASSLGLLLMAFLLWVVAGDNSPVTRKVTAGIFICLLFWGIDEVIYFFPLAAGMTLLAAAITFIAFLRARP